MFQKKSVLVMVPCDSAIQKELECRFGDVYGFAFTANPREEQLREAEVIIGEPGEEQLLQAEKLQWLQLSWAGADKYTRMDAFPSQVTLTNASGAFGTIISEYVIGAILAQYRGLPYYVRQQQKHIWKNWNQDETILGKKVLILGTGDIGSNIAMRLKAFGAETIGVKRRVNPADSYPNFDEVFSIDLLDDLLPAADIVVCCLPGTAETMGLMDQARFARMKETALFVNVGRGSTVVREDLIRALSAGKLRGAVLDVMDTEPLPEDSPLWDMENVLLTPHIAGPSFGADAHTNRCIWKICTENLERYARGEMLHNIVDRKAGY